MRITSENITELKPNEIFVFGSNEAGKHLGGAARLAWLKFGAIWGQGVGLQGNSFAVPTLTDSLFMCKLERIQEYVETLFNHAMRFRDNIYFITQIGCGIAGFTPKEIAPLFENFISLENVYLPKSFLKVIYKNKPWYDLKSKYNLLVLKFK